MPIVVALDPGAGFTMARGRNAGFRQLLEQMPALELVQFLDGDCELQPGWLDRGRLAMQQHPDAAVVSGRRRERDRNANVYHRLMDMEWDTPIGEVDACHGDALMRVSFLLRAGLFDESLIAGEEPELCARLRAAGGKILRVPAEMSLHDAAIDRFATWWRRCFRSGHAEAQCVARSRLAPRSLGDPCAVAPVVVGLRAAARAAGCGADLRPRRARWDSPSIRCTPRRSRSADCGAETRAPMRRSTHSSC